VKLRTQLPDSTSELSIAEIGINWARLIVQSECWNVDEATNDLIGLLYSEFPKTFQISFQNLVKNLLSAFQRTLSIDSYASMLDLFGRCSMVISMVDLEFLADVFGEFLEETFDRNTVVTRLYPLLAVAGSSFCFHQLDDYEFPSKWFFTVLLANISCSTMSIKKSKIINLSVKLSKELLSFAQGQFGYTIEAWENVQISSHETRENLGYLVFENFVQEEAPRRNWIHFDKTIQTKDFTESDFQLIVSEILNETDVAGNCFKLGQCTDSSLLIGAIAQVMETGIASFSTADHVNFCPLISGILKNAVRRRFLEGLGLLYIVCGLA